MIKIFVATIFIGGLGMLPVYVLDSTVLPQLQNLEQAYAGLDTIGEDVAAGRDLSGSQTEVSAKELSSQSRISR